MSERAVEITQSYSPAPGRTVMVEGIPATAVTLGADNDTVLSMDVCRRLDVLIERALRSTGDPVQRIAYTPDTHSVSSGPRVR